MLLITARIPMCLLNAATELLEYRFLGTGNYNIAHLKIKLLICQQK